MKPTEKSDYQQTQSYEDERHQRSETEILSHIGQLFTVSFLCDKSNQNSVVLCLTLMIKCHRFFFLSSNFENYNEIMNVIKNKWNGFSTLSQLTKKKSNGKKIMSILPTHGSRTSEFPYRRKKNS